MLIASYLSAYNFQLSTIHISKTKKSFKFPAFSIHSFQLARDFLPYLSIFLVLLSAEKVLSPSIYSQDKIDILCEKLHCPFLSRVQLV